MIAWLRRGAAAASLASDRSDLWPGASLGWLAYVGWIPLLLVVAPPRAADLAQLGVELVRSGAFPANVVALSVAVVAGAMLLYVVAAMAEVAVARGLGALPSRDDGASVPTLAVLAAMLLASVPAAVALTWLLLGAVESAPAVYSAPGPQGSFFLRLGATLAPQLAVFVVAVLLGQMMGGAVILPVLAAGGAGSAAAGRNGLRDLLRRPGPALATTVVAWLKDVLLFIVVLGLLRVLWEPIGRELGPGLLSNPEALVLLLGFVAIWLALLLMGGGLHAFVFAWRLLDRRAADEDSHRPVEDAARGSEGMPSVQGGGER